MSRFVIAGCANCPYFAKVELLAVLLARSLPNFFFKIICKYESEWQSFLAKKCAENNWTHDSSPLIWSEPMGFGGPRFYMGDANAFQEYAMGYYGVRLEMTSCQLYKIAEENLATKLRADDAAATYIVTNKKLHICVLNADTPLFYHLILAIADGSIFGDNRLILQLYESFDKIDKMATLVKEIEHLALPYIEEMRLMTQEKLAIQNCQVVIIFDNIKPNFEDNYELYQLSVAHSYMALGRFLEMFTSPNVNICLITFDSTIAGAKINYNSSFGANVIASQLSPQKKQNFILINGVSAEHTRSELAEKLNISASAISDLIIWGLPFNRNTFVIDTEHCLLTKCKLQAISGPGQSNYSGSISQFMPQDDWLMNTLPEKVEKRQLSEETFMGFQINLAMSDAIANKLARWMRGDGGDAIFTACVYSNGCYGLPEGMFLNLPVRFQAPGKYTIVSNLHLSIPLLKRINKAIQVIETEYPNILAKDLNLAYNRFSQSNLDRDLNINDSITRMHKDITILNIESFYNILDSIVDDRNEQVDPNHHKIKSLDAAKPDKMNKLHLLGSKPAVVELNSDFNSTEKELKDTKKQDNYVTVQGISPFDHTNSVMTVNEEFAMKQQDIVSAIQ